MNRGLLMLEASKRLTEGRPSCSAVQDPEKSVNVQESSKRLLQYCKPSCSTVKDPENSENEQFNDFADESFDDSDLDPDYKLPSDKVDEDPSADFGIPLQASSTRPKGSKLLQRKAIKSA